MRLLPILLVLAVIPLAGCGLEMTRTVVAHHFDHHTGTLWLVERDVEARRSDIIRVLVCHREASPACVRNVPMDLKTAAGYQAWLDTLPDEVRKLANAPPTGPPRAAPRRPAEAAPAGPSE